MQLGKGEDIMESKKKTVKRAVIITIASVLATVFVVLPSISLLIYDSVFGARFMTSPSRIKSVEDYPGLQRERYDITSNEGQKIAAYHYFREGQEVKGVVIMAHGFGGGGHNSYMNCASKLTENGYYAFAYDVTGNDESEGKSVRGLPQGVIDLDYVISFVEGCDRFDDLPILLFGHSWGGFSVSSVLNEHPEVVAVCAISGFNRSSDRLNAQGLEMVGPLIYLMLPYLKIYERVRFGKYATQTSMDGFDNSDAKVMIIHSEDDTTVPIRYGYDIYYAEHADDPDFVFVRYKNKGHNTILTDDVLEQAVDFYDSTLIG